MNHRPAIPTGAVAQSDPFPEMKPEELPPRWALPLKPAVLMLMAGLMLFFLGGCASSSSGGGSSFWNSGSIHELHLLVLPGAVKFDQSGATNGFAVRVFASDRSRAKGISIRSGTLEILGYEGSPHETDPRTMTPSQIWAYPTASLPPFAISTSLGTGYDLALPWQGQRPTNNRLTLVARYTSATGAVLLSAPSVIPNSLK